MSVQTRKRRRSGSLIDNSSEATSMNVETSRAESGKQSIGQTTVNEKSVCNHTDLGETIVNGVVERGGTQVDQQMLEGIFCNKKITSKEEQFMHLWNHFSSKIKEEKGPAFFVEYKDDAGELLLRFGQMYGKTIWDHDLYFYFVAFTSTLFDFGLVDTGAITRSVTTVQQQRISSP